MTTIGVHQAKTRFGELRRRIEAGETIVVTRYGMPVARIVPARYELADSAEAMEEIRRFREERKPTLGGVPIRELIEDGRE
jgi:prevent-host-death family protein